MFFRICFVVGDWNLSVVSCFHCWECETPGSRNYIEHHTTTTWFDSGRETGLHLIPPFLLTLAAYTCTVNRPIKPPKCFGNCLCVCVTGPVIGEFVSQLMPLLRCTLQPDKDPEMRMSVFTMLAKLLLDATNTLDSQGWGGHKHTHVYSSVHTHTATTHTKISLNQT